MRYRSVKAGELGHQDMGRMEQSLRYSLSMSAGPCEMVTPPCQTITVHVGCIAKGECIPTYVFFTRMHRNKEETNVGAVTLLCMTFQYSP